MDKVLLIDGHNAMWRASIGFAPPKKESVPDENVWMDNGQPFFTDVPEETIPEPEVEKIDYTITFNFFRNLRPIVEQFQPEKIFFILEGHAGFRYELFPEYKANRKLVKEASKQEQFDRFYIQKDIIIDLIRYLPVTIVRAQDYECDDVIATLAEDLKDHDVTILSSDSDFTQLLQKDYKSIKVYNPIAKKFLTAPPYPYVAWKCLVGDTSDNIPGFKGIGDKTAQKMLADPKRFSTFMEVEENRANFQIYKGLIELNRMVPPDELFMEEGLADWDALKARFTEMEFNSMINDKSWDKYVRTFNCVRF